MIHQKQPTPTTCGQACVAMLVGVSVSHVIDVLGGETTEAAELRQYLSDMEVYVDRKASRWPRRGLPAASTMVVMKAGMRKDGTPAKHWVVLSWEPKPTDTTPEKSYKVYDPALNQVHSLEKYNRKYMENAKFTAYFAAQRES